MTDKLLKAVPWMQLIVLLVTVIIGATLWIQSNSRVEATGAADAVRVNVGTTLESIEDDVADIKATVQSLDVRMRDVREWKAATDIKVSRCIDHVNNDHCLSVP